MLRFGMAMDRTRRVSCRRGCRWDGPPVTAGRGMCLSSGNVVRCF